ncbi:hypothetical protein MRX96_028198 [Rhipicephalus microplus]
MYCSSAYLEEGVVMSEKVVLFLCNKPPDGYCKLLRHSSSLFRSLRLAFIWLHTSITCLRHNFRDPL